DALTSMFRTKVAGAEFLHRLTASMPLDFFVLFSTAASVIGSEALAPYAAANQFLDALVHARRSQGLPGLAIDWGRWAVVSNMMSDSRHRWLEAQGMEAFTPSQGLATMEAL